MCATFYVITNQIIVDRVLNIDGTLAIELKESVLVIQAEKSTWRLMKVKAPSPAHLSPRTEWACPDDSLPQRKGKLI